MKPELRFEEQVMRVSELGEETSVPDIIGSMILQNHLEFDLEEDDEIFEAYGRKDNSYPYRQYQAYTRKLKEQKVKTAVLENDFLTAVFLPGLGGRLWSLTDKETGRNLLYTNDVIRFSNLAIRNAWFSGGVEWNIGIIGHTPLTTEQMYTASLKDKNENPVLRMYQFERVREVEYQMDFWLGPKDRFLNCRMRIVNSGREVVPMYWWSNMAVPEYEGGRIAVPAKEAYTNRNRKVFKTDIPIVEGVDISHYKDIPKQVDYFFNIRKEDPKYIANLDRTGYGLLQMSTDRLKSRKLFSWGNGEGSRRWQEFLTDRAGRYLEIQAGLGKTQYGCIPMPPSSAWEWIEQYGAVTIGEEQKELPFSEMTMTVTDIVKKHMEEHRIEQLLEETKAMAKEKASLVYSGSEYGTLQNMIRRMEGERELSGHLTYAPLGKRLKEWGGFLENGVLKRDDVLARPGDFQCNSTIYKKLRESVQNQNRHSWYAWYHLGLMELDRKHYKKAAKALKNSLRLEENPWALHGLSSLCLIAGKKRKAGGFIFRGILMAGEDKSYVKEGFRILLMAEEYEKIVALYGGLSKEIKKDSRIYFSYLTALSFTGEAKKAYRRLMKRKDFVLEDLREGEESLGSLYVRLYKEVYQKEPEKIPDSLNFDAGAV